ncbi:hypothetical protein [Pseudomonas aeruginosa]|uniref:hypothetical protein n=1 Tax=Pseudomonas aeruginosa TaxID=287 RepID=UPI000F534E50|nr:hypothetical protein [Pseudomonas aeruginosa]EIU1413925.1 hypothetical protein [Pseudomonas aeruginosa]MCG9956522.1 hypothetical protein [Pseudomonas aeruginosa]MCS7968627.1 hypothetical protein [Pseudomonas aeruginosa]MCS8135140.1 hypothetical protein [Pseudomonas aeruginosa]MCS8177492.1 hypothetical protein [Pseudomonas aeruginosa]
MKTHKPQISLAALAEALEAAHGTRIDPRTEAGRVQLLEVAERLLADPEEGQMILEKLSDIQSPPRQKSNPWPHKGQVRYLETDESIDDFDFLFDDIDHLRTTDALGRPLAENTRAHEISPHDVIITSDSQNIHLLASPGLLGFDEETPKRTFDQRALYRTLTRLQHEFKAIIKGARLEDSHSLHHPVKRATKRESDALTARDRLWNLHSADHEIWQVCKTIRAINFHEITVTHKSSHTPKHPHKKINVSYIGSGEDLFLQVIIDSKEVVKTKESLKRSRHLSDALLDALSNEPDAGLLIVDSMLEEIAPPPPAADAQSLES